MAKMIAIDWDRIDRTVSNPRMVDDHLVYTCDCGTEYRCDKVSDSYYMADDCMVCETQETELQAALTFAAPVALTHNPFEVLR